MLKLGLGLFKLEMVKLWNFQSGKDDQSGGKIPEILGNCCWSKAKGDSQDVPKVMQTLGSAVKSHK